MKKKILQDAIKKFSTSEYMPSISKRDLVSAGLMTGVAVPTAQKQGAIDLTSDDNLEKFKAGATVVSALGAGMLLSKGGGRVGRAITRKEASRNIPEQKIRDAGVSQIANNVRSDKFQKVLGQFYGSGFMERMVSIGQVAGMGGLRAIGQYLNPRESFATRMSGIPRYLKNAINTQRRDVLDVQEEVSKLVKPAKDASDEVKKAYNVEVKRLMKEKDIDGGFKILHNKIINDYSNALIFNKKPVKQLSDYAERFVNEISYKQLIKENKGLLPQEAIDNLINVQGIGKTGTKYLKLNDRALRQGGDVLRGIQFDSKSAKWFESVNRGEKSPEKIFENAISIFGKNSVFDLSNGKMEKIQIIFSPKMKPNIDWGGYAGTIVLDTKNPKEIIMMADDLRDLFGVKLGNTVLNVSKAQRTKFPQVLKKINETDTINRTIVPKSKPKAKLTKETKKVNVNVIKARANLAKEDIDRMVDLAESYEKNFKEWKLTPEFVGSRLGAGAGILGVYALASED
tara:strand:+ start:3247 stop:4782 length:1536 start_codon:yes stop_codon:yes gene_type:complete